MKNRVISFVLFVFFLVTPFNSRVYASGFALSPQLTGASGAIALSSEMFPPVAIVASALIAGGLVYQNRDELKVIATNVYNHMQDKIIDMGNGAYKIADGFVEDLIYNYNNIVNAPNIVFPASTFTYTTLADLQNQIYFYVPAGSTFGYTFYSGTNAQYSVSGPCSISYIPTGGIKDYGGVLYPYATIKKDGVIIAQSGFCERLNLTNPDFTGSARSVCPDLPTSLSNPLNLADGQVISFPVDSPIINNPTWDNLDGLIEFPIDGSISFPDVVGSIDGSIDIPGDTTVDTPGDTTGDSTSTVSWDWLKDILQKILDGILAIPASIIAFFTVDWSVVRTHMDYTSILTTHFKPFYDITNQLKNIQASPQGSDGKFYMKIPKAMGGDDQMHCVLDLSYGGVYITWARDIIKYSIWIAFLWYILKTFEPRFNIS